MTTRREPRERIARVEEVGNGTAGDDEVLVHAVAFVDVSFVEAVGQQPIDVTRLGGAPASAAARGTVLLAVGDLVTVDRRGNRWWIGGTVGSDP